MQISQPKVRVRLLRIRDHCRLKLRNRIRRPPQPIQRLPHQHMHLRRIRILLHDLPKFCLRTGKILRQQARLRQHLPQLRAVRIRLHHWLQILHRFRESLCAIATEPQQRPRLPTVRIARHRRRQRRNRPFEIPMLKRRHPPVELYARQLRIELRSFPIGRNSLRILALPRQHHPQARIRRGIPRVLLPRRAPILLRLHKVALLLRRHRLRGRRAPRPRP